MAPVPEAALQAEPADATHVQLDDATVLGSGSETWVPVANAVPLLRDDDGVGRGATADHVGHPVVLGHGEVGEAVDVVDVGRGVVRAVAVGEARSVGSRMRCWSE